MPLKGEKKRHTCFLTFSMITSSVVKLDKERYQWISTQWTLIQASFIFQQSLWQLFLTTQNFKKKCAIRRVLKFNLNLYVFCILQSYLYVCIHSHSEYVFYNGEYGLWKHSVPGLNTASCKHMQIVAKKGNAGSIMEPWAITNGRPFTGLGKSNKRPQPWLERLSHNYNQRQTSVGYTWNAILLIGYCQKDIAWQR